MLYLLSLIPGVVLFAVVIKADTVEKESPKLIATLAFCGALTVISAVILGLSGNKLMAALGMRKGSFAFLFIDSFIFTALVEEAGKFIVLKMISWKNREFNYTFDGVVYASAVSLGFALIENVIFLIRTGADASILRVALSVPGHMVFGIFMGYFYGQARYAEGVKEDRDVKRFLTEALLVPVFLHGFFVFGLRADRLAYFLIFAVYEIILAVITIRSFIRMSKQDTLIPGMEYTVEGGDER